MKKIKYLLAPVVAVATATPIAFATSCNSKSDAELIAEAIYKPTQIKEKEIIATTYLDKLKGFKDDEKKACLIYDLFGFFNVKGWRGLPSDKSFIDLYLMDDPYVSIATNITKCEYSINSNNKPVVSVLGYVSFVFERDYTVGQTNLFWKNNYVMITYDILNREVEIDEDNCCLKYERKDTSESSSECVGMIKERKGDSTSASSILYFIKNVCPKDDYLGLPTNFKNMSKN